VKERFIYNIFFAKKIMQGFDGDPLFWVDGGLLPLKGVLHVIDSMTNHLEERGNDTIQENIKHENSDSSIIVLTIQFMLSNLCY
jgi:hypothetical protein